MKKVLIVYIDMVTGGATTSLLSILNNLDYKEYHVDLLLSENQGDLYNDIPKDVNILPQAMPNLKILRLKKALSPRCVYNYIRVRISKKYKKAIVSQQIIAYDHAKCSRRLNIEYDIAISFLELWPTYYVADLVQAKRKIAWIHVDYREAGLLPELDVSRFKNLDKIVLVSETCKESFVKDFPQFKEKSICIKNVLSTEDIKSLSSEPLTEFKMNPNKLNISTVCRIVFNHKGLDRGVEAFRKLNEENLCSNMCWYIIGDGPDFERLQSLIIQYGLEHIIILLGKKRNPHQYIKESDWFFLPSLYEGKPMAVTEAMMLGVPPIVTEYNSAREQIEDGVDGIILKNDDDQIYEGLRTYLLDRTLVDRLKRNLRKRDYSNAEEMDKIYDILEGEQSGERLQ